MATSAVERTFAGPLTIDRDATVVLTIPLEPFGLYRLSFESRAAGPGYWFADFFNAAGEHNYADNHSGLDPATDWTPAESVFMARAEAVTGKLGFRVIQEPIEVRRVRCQQISKAEALRWMDAVNATLPPVRPEFPAERWALLPRTRMALQAGKTLRVVALGDSVSNDMLNGLGHLLVERAYPGTTLQIIHANGPEKSCDNYQRDEALARLVIRHRPELFTVAGMSHGDPDAIRAVIRKVRAACGNVETAFFDVRTDGNPDLQVRGPLLATLRRMAAEDGFVMCDLTTPFEDCMRRSKQPRSWYLRDHCHVNDRGKLLLGRLYAAFFAPA